MTSATDMSALQARLSADPSNEQARVDLAWAQTQAGDHTAAVETLTAGLRNLAAHEEPTLPCLCRRCLDPARAEAEAGGITFLRRFVAARGRVLFYWVPREHADDRGLARGVRASLLQRLKDPV